MPILDDIKMLLVKADTLAVLHDPTKDVHDIHLCFDSEEDAERLYSLIQRLR